MTADKAKNLFDIRGRRSTVCFANTSLKPFDRLPRIVNWAWRRSQWHLGRMIRFLMHLTDLFILMSNRILRIHQSCLLRLMLSLSTRKNSKDVRLMRCWTLFWSILLRGKFFEALAYKILSRGGTFTVKDFNRGGDLIILRRSADMSYLWSNVDAWCRTACHSVDFAHHLKKWPSIDSSAQRTWLGTCSRYIASESCRKILRIMLVHWGWSTRIHFNAYGVFLRTDGYQNRKEEFLNDLIFGNRGCYDW